MNDRFQVSPRQTSGKGRRVGRYIGRVRLTPTRTFLGIAVLGSLLYLLYALTVRDASQIPLLSSGAAVLGLAFAGLAVAGAIGAYRAAMADQSGRAFASALLGGVAAVMAFGSFAAAAVLALLWRS